MQTSLTAITLFVDDVAAAREFYARAFELPVHWEDDVSVVFSFNGTLINLLADSEAPSLIAPAAVASRDAGSRVQFTISVDDVGAEVAGLRSRGVELLNGPQDRLWGIRTAAFADPAGHVWELAQPI
jgi:catechol 2,3-dioxygenase-like lactoylglutathione lyase family enzyme